MGNNYALMPALEMPRGHTVRRTWKHDPTILAPPRYRRACGYDAFVPFPLADLELTNEAPTVSILSSANQLVEELNYIAGDEMNAFARLLVRSEAVASSRIEGMFIDARRLARAEARRDAGRSIGREAAEIIANIDAMHRAVSEVAQSDRVSVESLQSIHTALLERTPYRRIAGVLREEQNWIGGNNYNPCGADFVPPPPEHVIPLLQDLCDFCDSDRLPPLAQAAIAHAQFETIHPFIDGNGRTGRALIHVILRRRGLASRYLPPISVRLSQQRASYIAGLIAFRDGQVDDWLEIFAGAVIDAAMLAINYQRQVERLVSRWREMLREAVNPRSDAAAWAIIDTLPGHPVLTTRSALEATTRSERSVRDGIADLELAGVLTRITTSKRYRAWEPLGLLELVTALEDGQPPPNVHDLDSNRDL